MSDRNVPCWDSATNAGEGPQYGEPMKGQDVVVWWDLAGEKVLQLLFEEQQNRSLSLLLVTHDERLASRCDRVVYMEDGMIQMDSGLPIPE